MYVYIHASFTACVGWSTHTHMQCTRTINRRVGRENNVCRQNQANVPPPQCLYIYI